jgi:8-oxo-dGTP pyrophosphatase MutT (NUDIX family)/phosphohistidine phosphatase SixA
MPNNKPGSRLIKAAGGVAWRPGPDGEPEILLVHRQKYDDWSLPKGKVEPGEQLPVTAVREVLEEGGARLALGRRLVSVRYNVGGRPKRVHYWAARVLAVDERAVPNSEVDEVTWLSPARAVDKVSYAHDHGVLADFAARSARTVPLILVRHSKAVAKHGWKSTDAARPLDGSGRSDAKALADLLTCFAPRPRLISSTAARCADTLRPLAQLTGGQVRVEQSLYIHDQSPGTGAADSGSEITALLREVIASGEPTVICAHRENLPELREAALAVLAGHPDDASGAVAPGDALAKLPKDWDVVLPTSGFWVLNVAPLLSAREPERAEQDLEPAAPEPPDSAATASALNRRRWQLRRARSGRVAGPRPPSEVAGADVAGRDVAGGDVAGGDVAGGGVASGAARGNSARGGSRDRGPSSGETRAGNGEPASAAGRVGVLISADRYDLSEP